MSTEKLLKILDKRFEDVYLREIRNGKTPIEFAGPKGKEILKRYFEAGMAAFAIESLLCHYRELKKEEKP